MSAHFVLLAVSLAQAGNTDDRDVIQAALLSFFKHEEWYSADWHPKNHVVLSPKYVLPDRPDFKIELSGMEARLRDEQQWLRNHPNPKESGQPKRREGRLIWLAGQIKILSEAKRTMYEGPSYSTPATTPVTSFQWDKKIKVTSGSNRFSFSHNKRDTSLEEWTVYAYPTPPAFSPNGQYAIVNFSIPWSIHSADVIFLCQRTPNGWVKVASSAKFYV